VDAAVAVVAAEGFGALSLRSVARQLGVGPMTLYTYVDGSDELGRLVIDRLVGEAARGVRWPSSWPEVLRLLAKRFDALVTAHPAMVEAYGRDMVHSDAVTRVAKQVQERLVADGLTPEKAIEAYIGVHALVLGCATLRPSLTTTPLMPLVDRLIEGIAAG
jgi:AcrR family transcriptional regulator